ncbi:hypothetical protein HanXRQr2_Chr13g0617501 [Helianthus annuus]|uniref:Uncharacterized protein n=1 Tax=Helianthus annuus TaxID=4232 RepID=A0A9K3ENK8_HELAN|nr:hypothetical protein HanXRQr2_Chr13g0617501 [Helianthus annuus]
MTVRSSFELKKLLNNVIFLICLLFKKQSCIRDALSLASEKHSNWYSCVRKVGIRINYVKPTTRVLKEH